jgi:hypothetical protein
VLALLIAISAAYGAYLLVSWPFSP